MADNVFNIRITAVDQATKVVNKVNKSVSQIFRPYDNAKKSVSSFFTALGKNDLFARPAASLQFLGSSVGQLGASFGVAENSILSSTARIAGALGSIGGPVGGFIAGGVAAAGAATAVTAKMGEMGLSITRIAGGIGITTDQLQVFRSVAKQSGVETQAMDDSLQSFAARLTDVAADRAPELANTLAAMHISLKKNKDGTVDLTQAWREYMDAVNGMNDPNQQRIAADQAGLTGVITVLRQGRAEFDRMADYARKTGQVLSPQQLQALERQGQAWNNIKSAVDGIGTSLGNVLSQYGKLESLATSLTKIAEAAKAWSEKKADDTKSPFLSSPLLAGPKFLQWLISGSSSTPANPTASGKVTDANPALAAAGRVAAGAVSPGALFSQLESQYKLPNSLLDTVWNRESKRGDPRFMLSPKGAKGHFGLMDPTAREYGVQDPNDLADAAAGSAHIWADLLSKYHGDLRKAAVAYNWGQGNLDRQGIDRAPRESRDYADAVMKGTSGSQAINLTVHNVPAGLTVKVASASERNVGLAFAAGSAD